MGPSGAGTSSVLSYATGTLAAGLTGQGRVLVGANSGELEDVTGLPPEKRGLGILFQDDLLFPHMSVGENLAFAIPRRIKNREERRSRIASALSDVSLDGFGERDPATLSGGQRARVALARALLAEPRATRRTVLKLDQTLRDQVREMVFGLGRDRLADPAGHS